MKLHKCKVCRSLYVKTRPLQVVCSAACALTLARENVKKSKELVAKAEKKVIKAKLDGMKTRPELLKDTQTAFNAYVRYRDMGKPCISCGRPDTGEPNSRDASHYRSVGSAPHMRFAENNCFASCKHCNQHLAGNHVEYRKRLVKLLGVEAVEALEADNTTRKYTRDELIELAKHYRQLTRELKNGVK
jgi:hypothetical protein